MWEGKRGGRNLIICVWRIAKASGDRRKGHLSCYQFFFLLLKRKRKKKKLLVKPRPVTGVLFVGDIFDDEM